MRPRPTRRPLLLLAVLPLAGCTGDGKLVTGYEYRRLGSTEVQRRAFYADRYSVEAVRSRQQGDSNPVAIPQSARPRR